MKTYKEDHKLMDLLKLNEISRVICDTNMGTLKLRIRKGEKEYRFVLDSVELDKNTNKEVFELLYPVKNEPTVLVHSFNGYTKTTPLDQIVVEPGTLKQETLNVRKVKDNKDGTHTLTVSKSKGRPKGTKNKK